MKIVWTNRPVFKRVPLLLVLAVVLFIGFNVYLYIKIQTSGQELARIEAQANKPPRVVPAAFAKKIALGAKGCPSIQAGNPNAPLTFKLFESQTCPFCTAQNKVLDELLPEYGDLFYGEWYDVIDCQEEAGQYKIYGVPTFVFTARGVEKEPAYGFLDKAQLAGYLCAVSEQC